MKRRTKAKISKLFQSTQTHKSNLKMSKYLRAHGKPWIERVLTPSLSIIYPPYSKTSRKMFFLLFFHFPLLDKIKDGGDSCLPYICKQKTQKPIVTKNSQFCHRITELATLLGKIYKVEFTLGSRSF